MRVGFQPAFAKFRFTFVRVLATALTTVLVGESAFAHKPQASLWEERGSRKDTQLASLAQAGGWTSGPARLGKLLANSPAISTLTTPADVHSIHLPPDFLSHVRVRRAVGMRPNVNPVIVLEDVHRNVEAQKNISAAIQSLGRQPGVVPVTVCLEGAGKTRLLFSEFHSFPNARIASTVADSYLESGDIAGPSHAGFVLRPQPNQRGLTFTGADDLVHHQKNIDAYRRSKSVLSIAQSRLSKERRRLDAEKRDLFSSDLAAFDSAVQRYQRGDIPLADHVQKLAEWADPMIHVQQFLEAHRAECRLDMNRVDRERRFVLEKLVSTLPQKDIADLVSLSVGYQKGGVTFGGYYGALRRMCDKAGVDLRATPAFDDYVRYVLLADGIDAEGLFSDLETMERQIYERLATAGETKRLVDEIRRLRLTERLIEFGLTSRDWVQYQASRFPDDVFSPFEDFYEEAEIRDRALALNTVRAETNREDGLTVLVVGGFHTEGVVSHLQKEGRTVLVCAPKLFNVEGLNGSAYLSVFDRERAPLDRLFAGEKLFVVATPAGVPGEIATPRIAHDAAALTLADNPDPALIDRVNMAANALGDSTVVIDVRRENGVTTLTSRAGDGELETLVGPGDQPHEGGFFHQLLERRRIGTEFLISIFIKRSIQWETFALGLGSAGVAFFYMDFETLLTGLANHFVALSSPIVLFHQYDEVVLRLLYVLLVPGLMVVAAGAVMTVLTIGESKRPGGARNLRELVDGEKGMRTLLEGVGKDDVAPNENIVLLAELLSSAEPDIQEAASQVLAQSPLTSFVQEGVRDVSVTAAGLVAEIGDGRFDKEIQTLRARGINDLEEIFWQIKVAVSIVARAIVARENPQARVVVEMNMDLVTRHGVEDTFLKDVANIAGVDRETGRAGLPDGIYLRIPTYIAGQNAHERRHLVNRVIYRLVHDHGVVPEFSLDMGLQTYVLAMGAFVQGVHDRCVDLFDENATIEDIQNEVRRLTRSLHAVSATEFDREPEVGTDALIDGVIARLEADAQDYLRAIKPDTPATIADLNRESAERSRAQAKELAEIRGRVGLAMAKLTHLIFRHIFFDGQKFPEGELEDVTAPWLVTDVLSIRGAVSMIRGNTGVPLRQSFMVAAPDGSSDNASALVRTVGLAGGWSNYSPAQTHAFEKNEMPALLRLLENHGLTSKERIEDGIPPAYPGSDTELGVAAAFHISGDDVGPIKTSVDVLRVMNKALKYLSERDAVPSEILENRLNLRNAMVTVMDLAETIQNRMAMRLGELHRVAVRSVAARMENGRTTQNATAKRDLENRFSIAFPFLLVIAGVLYFWGNPLDGSSGWWKLALIGVLAVTPLRMLWQWIVLVWSAFRVRRRWTPGKLHWKVASFGHVRSPGRVEAGLVLGGKIVLDRDLLAQMPMSQQRSVMAEEIRHLRYQRYWNIASDAERNSFMLYLEELAVNLVMPLLEFIWPDREIESLKHDHPIDYALVKLRISQPSFGRVMDELQPSTRQLKRVVSDFMFQVEAGLDGHAETLEMIRTSVRMPTGQETGYVIVVDWGGSKAKFSLWELQGQGQVRLVKDLPDHEFTDAERRNPRGLYPMLVDHVETLVNSLSDEDGQRNFAVVVGFAWPPSQWSKGWSDPEGIDPMDQEELKASFNSEFTRRRLNKLQAEKGENDTMGPMMIETYVRRSDDSKAAPAGVSIILGTGHNIAAFINGVIWNLESGAYMGPALAALRTSMDEDTDRYSEKPGVHLFEKMVAGGNEASGGIGEVLRNAIVRLRSEAGLFLQHADILDIPNAMSATFVSRVAATDGHPIEIQKLLETHGIRATVDECLMLYAMAEAVLDRAARFVAAEVAAVIYLQDPSLAKHHFVVIEGSVFELGTRFPQRMKNGLSEIFNDAIANRIHLIPNKGRIGAGTAVLRLVSAGSHRSLWNRLWLALSFVAPLTVTALAVLAMGVHPFSSRWLMGVWFVLALWALGAVKFLYQAFWILLAMTKWKRGVGMDPSLPYLPSQDLGLGVVAVSVFGETLMNEELFERLPWSQQRSTWIEEQDHIEHLQNKPVIPLPLHVLAWNEWYVNVVMPLKRALRLAPARQFPSRPESHVDDETVDDPDENGPFEIFDFDHREAWGRITHQFRRTGSGTRRWSMHASGVLGMSLLLTGHPIGWVALLADIVGWSVAYANDSKTAGVAAALWAAAFLVSPTATVTISVVGVAGIAAFRFFGPVVMARLWLSEGRRYEMAQARPLDSSSLAEALDRLAPKGSLFAAAIGKNREQARRTFAWGAFAGYRRSVARHGGQSVDEVLGEVDRPGLKHIGCVYHVGQLGNDPRVLEEELVDLERLIERTVDDNAGKDRAFLIAAVASGVAADVRARVDEILSRAKGAAVSVNVTDKLLRSGRYSALLERATAGTDLAAWVKNLYEGDPATVSFVSFSKIPSQFLADGRLRRIWMLLCDIGAGWARISTDTLIEAARIAGRNA